MEKIEKLAYDEIKKRIDSVSDADRGVYFHGWFDCLYFVSEIINKEDKGVDKENEGNSKLSDLYAEK